MNKFRFTRHTLGILNTILEMLEKSPRFLQLYADNCLQLSELIVEFENNVISSSVSPYRHKLEAEHLGDNMMIDSALGRPLPHNKKPRMKREYERNYYTTTYANYWKILVTWAMRKASHVPRFQTTFPTSDVALANLTERSEEGKPRSPQYTKLSLEAYQKYLEKWEGIKDIKT